MQNKDLKAKYDEMHSQGPSSWFSDGKEERELILKMGKPWEGKLVVEIGCGEGDLTNLIYKENPYVVAIDYSEVAIKKAQDKHPHISFRAFDYTYLKDRYDRIVMQGVLEHLNDPFKELKWMMDNLLVERGDVITSSPCFLNPRGIVWMTLDMLGAVMTKTDLHYLHPYNFSSFARNNGYGIETSYCDKSWGNGTEMVRDLSERIPLALKDGNLPKGNVEKLLIFLEMTQWQGWGATAVYKITK